MSHTGQRHGMSMKRLIALAFLLIASPAHALDDEIRETCLKAADFKGCVEVMSGNASMNESPISKLVPAMKMLSSRLDSVSLSTLSERSIPFRDALALANNDDAKTDHDLFLLYGAQEVNRMISALSSAWQSRIYNGTGYTSPTKYTSSSSFYICRYLKNGVSGFNSVAPHGYEVRYNGRMEKFLLGKIEKCSPQEYQMINQIQRYIVELSVDPKVKAKQMKEQKRRKELCKLEPWSRYLEENPGMKVWAEANPGPAEKQKKEFLSDPKDQDSCSGSKSSRRRALEYFNRYPISEENSTQTYVCNTKGSCITRENYDPP